MVAGPNGSGKSSLYNHIGTEAFDRSVWIINPDLLSERIRPVEGLTAREANIVAVVRVEAWLEASIRAYQTIGVETVPGFSSRRIGRRSTTILAKNHDGSR
jgi:predicted ABC-type ATPase